MLASRLGQRLVVSAPVRHIPTISCAPVTILAKDKGKGKTKGGKKEGGKDKSSYGTGKDMTGGGGSNNKSVGGGAQKGKNVPMMNEISKGLPSMTTNFDNFMNGTGKRTMGKSGK